MLEKTEKKDLSIIDKLNYIQWWLKAAKSNYNSFGKYSYRSCEDIVEAIKPWLIETNTILLLTDELMMIWDRYYIKATATIKDNSWEISVNGFAREEENKKWMDGAQITGWASSYSRKYALNWLLAIDDTKDGDATNTHWKEENKVEAAKTESWKKPITQEIMDTMKKALANKTATIEQVKKSLDKYEIKDMKKALTYLNIQ